MSEPARGRPPLPAEAILTDALGLLSTGGVATLGMRALARSLGSSTSTLYRQFPGGKDELCRRLAEHVLTEVVAEIGAADLGDEWGAIVEGSAVIAFDVLCRHPHSAELFAGQLEFGPMGLVRYETSLRLLMGAGLSPTDAAAADHALARLIIGYALQFTQDEIADRTAAADYYRALDTDQYPAITTVAPALPKDLGTEFGFALQTFMAGLRELVATSRGTLDSDA